MGRIKPKRTSKIDSGFADRYVNRELSWLEFNRRVLAEAANPANPLLERAKFLSIFESNLDEFYMVRVSGLIEQVEGGYAELTPDGLSPREQLQLIYECALPMRRDAGDLLVHELLPQLEQAGIAIRKFGDLTNRQRDDLQDYFRRDVFPICTPLILHPNPSVPFISNRSLNLAVILKEGPSQFRLARVKIPTILPRLIPIQNRRTEFVLLEDLVANNLPYLFPGVEIENSHLFRIIRDADVEIRALEAADLVATIEATLQKRRFGDPVRIDLQPNMPEDVHRLLLRILELDPTDEFSLQGHLGLEFLYELTKIDRGTLKYPVFQPYLNEAHGNSKALFDSIRKSDIFLHQPFDSFAPVEVFVKSAVEDPAVIGIKQTLYRVGSESPIVESLLEAAEDGKQVAVMVELKARFDESNNLIWSKALERAGAHVSYGFHELKTHAKLCLIVRRESNGLRTYAHVGTGNYNPATGRHYTDFGLFTDDSDITQDIAELFNFLTGFSKQSTYRKLLVAPLNLREGIIDRIDREKSIHQKKGGGRIIFKLNSLVDPETIDSLYEASQAGVSIDLIVRGICCLRPGVKGLSENIRVTSIVGRFLEHSRGYYFGNGGSPELYIGSADLMRRNLDRRIEVLAPVERASIVKTVHDEVLSVCLKDNMRAWNLLPDGRYERKSPGKGEAPFESQTYLVQNPTSRKSTQRNER